MDLFSKKKKTAPQEMLFSEREMEFNKERLHAVILKLSSELYNYRNDESHKIYTDYLRHFLNLEILKFSEAKADREELAYLRGRIAGLRDVLNAREVYITNKDLLRKSGDPNAQEAKRSYVRSPSTQAGLSI